MAGATEVGCVTRASVARIAPGTRIDVHGTGPHLGKFTKEVIMTTQTLEAELLELEHKFWQAMKNHDTDVMVELTDDPCLLGGAQGVQLIKREALREMMKSPNWTLKTYEIKGDPQIHQLSDDVVAVGYEVHEELTVDGKPVKLDAVESSTWVRRNNHWLCAAHTDAIKGDPFGRDRN
jgi:hypothetical protein